VGGSPKDRAEAAALLAAFEEAWSHPGYGTSAHWPGGCHAPATCTGCVPPLAWQEPEEAPPVPPAPSPEDMRRAVAGLLRP